jgi:autotransporter passenger strand-loop-strand repeat protein
LTAAHVVKGPSGFAKQIEVSPSPGSSFQYAAISVDADPDFVPPVDGIIPQEDASLDFAVIDVSEDLSNYGIFGLQPDYTGGTVNLTGYPLNLSQTNDIGTVAANPIYNILDYGSHNGVVSISGDSGGPLWRYNGTTPTAVGIVSTDIYGVQLTESDIAIIQGWEAFHLTTVSPEQTLVVSAGQSFSGITVLGGGTMEVLAGGMTSNTVISGGTLDVQAGAIVSGSIGFAAGTGGTLQIDAATVPGNLISGFSPRDTIDLTGVGFSSAGHARLLAGNDLQITENGNTYDLQLDPTQNFAGDVFKLASDTQGGTDITVGPIPPSAPSLGNGLGVPGAAATTNLTTPVLTGTAVALATVVLLDGTTQVGVGQANAQGIWTITASPLSVGSHALTAVATDFLGNKSAPSPAAQITVSSATTTNFKLGNSNAILQLGNKNNTVSFGDGAVVIIVGDGDNKLQGGNANNVINVGNGNDTIRVGNGNNQITIGTGTDVITAGDGNNVITDPPSKAGVMLRLGNGNNRVILGDGSDTVKVGKGTNTITLGNGVDQVQAGDGADFVMLGNGNDTIKLGDGNDTVTGGGGSSNIQWATAPTP